MWYVVKISIHFKVDELHVAYVRMCGVFCMFMCACVCFCVCI